MISGIISFAVYMIVYVLPVVRGLSLVHMSIVLAEMEYYILCCVAGHCMCCLSKPGHIRKH